VAVDGDVRKSGDAGGGLGKRYLFCLTAHILRTILIRLSVQKMKTEFMIQVRAMLIAHQEKYSRVHQKMRMEVETSLKAKL